MSETITITITKLSNHSFQKVLYRNVKKKKPQCSGPNHKRKENESDKLQITNF